VGAGADGRVFSKEDDLAAYWSRSIPMVRMEKESMDVHDDGITGRPAARDSVPWT